MSELVTVLEGYEILERIEGAKMRAFWEKLLSFSFRHRWAIVTVLVLYWLLDNVYAGTGNPIFDLIKDFRFPDGEISLLLAVILVIGGIRYDLLTRINEIETKMTKEMGEFRSDMLERIGGFRESLQREMREHIKHFHSK